MTAEQGPGRPIRVIVADDSPTARALIVALLGDDPEISVVAEASDGREVVALTRSLRPDVVTMDIDMPALDGHTATIEIMQSTPVPVVVVSGIEHAEVERAMTVLRTGAVAAVAKPVGPVSRDFEVRARMLVEVVKAMAGVKVVQRRLSDPYPPAGPRSVLAPYDVVGIAASTGGPAALHRILMRLSPRFDRPVLVVQHLSPGFLDGFARWLQGATSLPVRIASEGEAPVPGTIHLAADGHHLRLGADGRLHLGDDPALGGFRPSADPLFASLAAACGARALAIVLSGMGEDGLAGVRAVRKNRGAVIAQDEASALIFGMPGAAVKAGLATAVLSPEEIAEALNASGGR